MIWNFWWNALSKWWAKNSFDGLCSQFRNQLRYKFLNLFKFQLTKNPYIFVRPCNFVRNDIILHESVQKSMAKSCIIWHFNSCLTCYEVQIGARRKFGPTSAVKNYTSCAIIWALFKWVSRTSRRRCPRPQEVLMGNLSPNACGTVPTKTKHTHMRCASYKQAISLSQCFEVIHF
jgi:hypothetical protein